MVYLKTIELENCGPFASSGRIELSPKTTVIVGENGAGKTSLLEVMQRLSYSHPHLSLSRPVGRKPPQCRIKFSIGISKDELFESMREYDTVQLPLGQGSGPSSTALKLLQRHLLQELKMAIEFEHEITVHGDGNVGTSKKILDTNILPYAPIFGSENMWVQVGADDILSRVPDPKGTAWGFEAIKQRYRGGAYRFAAERLSIGSSVVQAHRELSPDGSNLPAAIHFLQTTNPKAFNRYLEDVRRVLPSIRYIQAPILGAPNNMDAVLQVWKHSPETERPDLAFSLKASGTGVAQVMALVYVITTSSATPRTILIDEPQAFLHPRALRNLLHLIMEHPQHQYIIATHSASVLSILKPDAIVEIRPDDREELASRAWTFGSDDLDALRTLFTNLDVRWSELFGWDALVWVEGPTEVACFRPILEHFFGGTEFKRTLQHVGLQPLFATGDLDAKKEAFVDRVLEIYARASQPQLILPPRVLLLLDTESRDSRRRHELKKRAAAAGIELHWLERRMFESYLLVPEAICALISSLESQSCAVDRVKEMFDAHPGCDVAPDFDAARFIDGIVGELTGHRSKYRKVEHGPWLTKWILENKPEHLEGIAQQLKTMLTDKPQR